MLIEAISREDSIKALDGLLAAQSPRYPAEIVQKLQSFNEQQAGLNEVLFKACELGDFLAAELALKAGAKVDATDKYGCTPARSAACGNHRECFQLLLDHGAEVNTAIREGIPYIAPRIGKHDCLKLLLANANEANETKDAMRVFGKPEALVKLWLNN